MKIKIKKLINKYEKNIIKDIIEIIDINTVWEDGLISKENPLGEGITLLFKKLSKWAEKDGFMTSNIDNVAMDISLGEKSNNYIGILVHADTVPANPESFSFDPFKGTYDGTYIYGRGTQDDKGPMIGIYYALKIIKELKIPLKREVRIIVGGNEETQYLGIIKYFKNNVFPIASFTADNEFPLINVELGGSTMTGLIPIKDENIIDFKGGEVVNAVAEYSSAIIRSSKDVVSAFDNFLNFNNVTGSIKAENDIYTINIKGKPSHGSIPQNGVSAITYLAKFISQFSDDLAIKFIVDKFHNKFYGEGFNLKIENEKSKMTGQTSSSIGKVKMLGRTLELEQDVRFSSLHTVEYINKTMIEAYSILKGTVDLGEISKPLYIKEDKPLVQILMNAYKDITGDFNAKPLISGGGTYAKEAPNCLAFGAMFPGEEQRMHNIDERLNVESLKKSIEIYVKAIVDLANNDWK